MFDLLKQYQLKGSFIFSPDQSYKDCCNAPSDKGGIYLIYKLDVREGECLLYIGSSGQRAKDGTLKIRRGGLKDRLINGYHPNRFGEDKRIKRYIALPNQMEREDISAIRVDWWVTYHEKYQDFPTDVEAILREEYIQKYGCMPSWHKK